MAAAIGAEGLLACVAFLPPTLLMGALFSHLCEKAYAAGLAFGSVIGVNTLGACLAPPLFGVVLAPAIGPGVALVVVAAGYLALAGAKAWRRPGMWVPPVAALTLVLGAPPLAFVDVPEG